MIKHRGLAGGPLLRQNITLCFKISESVSKNRYLQQFRDKKWPLGINFFTLPGRIVRMRDELLTFFTSRTAIQAHFVYENLKRRLLRLKQDFSRLTIRSASLDIIQHSYPG